MHNLQPVNQTKPHFIKPPPFFKFLGVIDRASVVLDTNDSTLVPTELKLGSITLEFGDVFWVSLDHLMANR